MSVRIEFCSGSDHPGMAGVKTIVAREFPRATIKEWDCLSHCHGCFRRPFALLNDTRLIEADTAEALLEQLRVALRNL